MLAFLPSTGTEAGSRAAAAGDRAHILEEQVSVLTRQIRTLQSQRNEQEEEIRTLRESGAAASPKEKTSAAAASITSVEVSNLKARVTELEVSLQERNTLIGKLQVQLEAANAELNASLQASLQGDATVSVTSP